VGICNWKYHNPNEPVVKEGDVSKSFYFIAGGDAVVTQTGVELGKLGKGDCFGEIAYLDEARHSRLATVTAASKLHLIEIQGDALIEASDRLQSRFAKAFLNLMVNRLNATNRKLLTQQKQVKSS
jgi:eukaryotic-like serine/threonine-protein kinase